MVRLEGGGLGGETGGGGDGGVRSLQTLLECLLQIHHGQDL